MQYQCPINILILDGMRNIKKGVKKMKGILDKTLKEKFVDMLKGKKGVMNEVIGAFILLLVVSIIAGMTFLFLSTMKDKIEATATGGTASTAYQAVNDTEEAGTTIVDFLPILFLAIIFGAILTVVLRVILPFINLGQQAGF